MNAVDAFVTTFVVPTVSESAGQEPPSVEIVPPVDVLIGAGVGVGVGVGAGVADPTRVASTDPSLRFVPDTLARSPALISLQGLLTNSVDALVTTVVVPTTSVSDGHAPFTLAIVPPAPTVGDGVGVGEGVGVGDGDATPIRVATSASSPIFVPLTLATSPVRIPVHPLPMNSVAALVTTFVVPTINESDGQVPLTLPIAPPAEVIAGLGVGEGVGVGLALGVGVGTGAGVGLGVGVGSGLGLGAGVGSGFGLGLGVGVGAGVNACAVTSDARTSPSNSMPRTWTRSPRLRSGKPIGVSPRRTMAPAGTSTTEPPSRNRRAPASMSSMRPSASVDLSDPVRRCPSSVADPPSMLT